MKTRFWVWVTLLFVAAGSVKAQLYDQWASMEYKQWSFESHDKYYYSRKWGTIVNLPWPLPDIKGWKGMEHGYLGYHDKGLFEELTHLYVPFTVNPYAVAAGHWDAAFSPDGYVSEDWRQQTKLRTPAAAEAVLYKMESNRQEDYWSKIRNLDVVTIADRSGVLSGLTGASTVTASERQESMDVVNEAYDLIQDEGAKERMMEEYHELQEKVNVIDGAHMDNARKVVAMQEINKEYKEMERRVTNTVILEYFMKKNEESFKGLKEHYSWVKELCKELGLDDSVGQILNLVDLNKL